MRHTSPASVNPKPQNASTKDRPAFEDLHYVWPAVPVEEKVGTLLGAGEAL